jgi:hypothetical protein
MSDQELLIDLFFQEFKIADEQTCKARWGGLPNGALFYCAFCGKQFEPGVAYKAIFTNDIGNPLCCRACFVDNGGSDAHMRELWKLRCEKWDEGYKGEWRWFQDHCHRAPHAANEAHWQHEVQETARDVRDEMRSRLEGR